MRIIVCILTLVGILFAIPRPSFNDFLGCYQKNKASMLIYEGLPAFALDENTLAVVKTKDGKLNKYTKYDPFLNLYLVKTDFSLIPAPMANEEELTRSNWVGILDDNKSYIGHLKYFGQNLTEGDQLDFETKIGELNSPCCKMLGITLDNGKLIGNRYLKHFMKYPDVYWGDIGVDFEMRDGKIYVKKIRKNGQFLLNDELIVVDGEPYDDIRKLNEKILFSDRGSTLYFNVLRDNEDLNISTMVFDKDLGIYAKPKKAAPAKPTSFYSNLGLRVDTKMNVIEVSSNSKAQMAGFLVGDKILRVNNHKMHNMNEFQNILMQENSFDILISRKATNMPSAQNNNLEQINKGYFDFFIRLNK
ncbi:PDZ domain-containing protein [Campylobacter insulaenigrae]|uniref:PDZ domain-containing protein n=1 Tax=Campylobacter insulaenigrae TaxID=260714 RepID=UPI00215279E1|nr:PDZ domain-containing protein [Campylobacter insulaenigrae]MCR6593759.1 PDZ domain-containing protein [Campylobacter insulaenigrae]